MAERATASLPWQPEPVHAAYVRSLSAQSTPGVGIPSTMQGIAEKTWPVAVNAAPVASVVLKECTWHPAHSSGFDSTVPCVPTSLPASMPGGNQPASPRSSGPCGECAPREVFAGFGTLFRWWHFMHRFASTVDALMGNRSCALLGLPCGSWHTAQVMGT